MVLCLRGSRGTTGEGDLRKCPQESGGKPRAHALQPAVCYLRMPWKIRHGCPKRHSDQSSGASSVRKACRLWPQPCHCGTPEDGHPALLEPTFPQLYEGGRCMMCGEHAQLGSWAVGSAPKITQTAPCGSLSSMETPSKHSSLEIML